MSNSERSIDTQQLMEATRPAFSIDRNLDKKIGSVPMKVPMKVHTLAEVMDLGSDQKQLFEGLNFCSKILHENGELWLSTMLTAESLKEDPYYVPQIMKLGQQLFDLERYESSMLCFQAAKQLDESFQNLKGLADSNYKMGRDAQALDLYFEAMLMAEQPDAQLFEVYKNVGNIYVRAGDYDLAEDFYNKAHVINSTSDVLKVNYATLAIQKCDEMKALKFFREALQINDRNDLAWTGLSMIHNSFGDFDLAWANLQKAVDINPRNKTALSLIVSWALRDSKIDRAIRALLRSFDFGDFDLEMSFLFIEICIRTKKYNWAMMEVSKALLFEPQDVRLMELESLIREGLRMNEINCKREGSSCESADKGETNFLGLQQSPFSEK